MANTTMRLPIRRLMQDTTMEVCITGMRAFRVRQWITVRLMAIAAVVLGCGIEIEIREN